MRICHFRAQNGPLVMNKTFLVQTIIITFIYLLALFIVKNLKKFLQQIQSYKDVLFLGPKLSICPLPPPPPLSPPQKIFFFKKLLIPFSSTFSPFHCAKLKQFFFGGSRVMRMCNLGSLPNFASNVNRVEVN